MWDVCNNFHGTLFLATTDEAGMNAESQRTTTAKCDVGQHFQSLQRNNNFEILVVVIA